MVLDNSVEAQKELEAKYLFDGAQEHYNLTEVVEMYNKIHKKHKKLRNFKKRKNILGDYSICTNPGGSTCGNILVLIELLFWLDPVIRARTLIVLADPMYDYGNIVNNIFYHVALNSEHSIKKHVTYIGVSVEDPGLYKIGRSKDPDKRALVLGIELLVVISEDIEPVLLNTYSNKRSHGEWFLLDEKDVYEIKVKYNDKVLFCKEEYGAEWSNVLERF